MTVAHNESPACTQLGISRVSGINIWSFLREVCSTVLLRAPVLLGGPGRIVQIDESLFCHKCKYHDRHINVPRHRVYAAGGEKECCNTAAHHPAARRAGYDGVQ